MTFSEVQFSGPAFNNPMSGGVIISAAEGTAQNGTIEVYNIRASQITGPFRVTASLNNAKGEVKVGNCNITATGLVLFETGPSGVTEVKDNRITSSTRITIKTSPSGTCNSSPNFTLEAPVVQSCLPLAGARLANIFETAEMPALSVYPNPSNDGNLNIQLKESKEQRDISITNVTGMQVKNWQGVTSSNLVADGLKSGVYVISVLNKKLGLKSSSKFIVE